MSKAILIILVVAVVAIIAFVLFGRNSSSVYQPKEAKTQTTETMTDQQSTQTQTTPTASSNSTLANPASVNCTKQGGTLTIQTMGNGGQYGLCNFEDDQACEEWALYRGDCPVGGVKTIGFNNIEQSYCAWLGGQTLAVSDAKCTLPGGKVCNDKALYAGTCSASN